MSSLLSRVSYVTMHLTNYSLNKNSDNQPTHAEADDGIAQFELVHEYDPL